MTMQDEHLSLLVRVLSDVAPYEPIAVQLLRQRRAETGELWPLVENRNQLVRATVELREYSTAAQDLIGKLSQLSPVAVASPHSEAFPL